MKAPDADFFVLRSPLLPYDDLAAWSSDLEAPGAVDDAERLEGALAADRGSRRAAHRRHTRLDMHYLCGLIGALERDPLIRARLRFRPNSSLYRFGDRWHWTELTPDDPRHSIASGGRRPALGWTGCSSAPRMGRPSPR